MKTNNPKKENLFGLISKLQQENFSAAIIFNVYSQSSLPAALLCLLSGIPRRLAYSHENPYELLTNWIPDPEPQKFIRHEVQRQLDLVGEVGFKTKDLSLKLALPPNSESRVKLFLKNKGVDERNLVILHPGASEQLRRFDKQFFINLGKYLVETKDSNVLVTGSAGEISLCEEVANSIGRNTLCVASKLNLEEFCNLIKHASLVVTNNTATSHIAASFNTPEIVFYATTNFQHTPWRNPNSKVFFFSVFCKNCKRGVCGETHQEKSKTVHWKEVVEACEELLYKKTLSKQTLEVSV